jgi:hypothetical protein
LTLAGARGLRRLLERLRRAGGQANGVAVLGVPDEPARKRRLAMRGTTQLAYDALLGAAIEMHLLACERRATAVRTAIAVGFELAQPAPQEHALE